MTLIMSGHHPLRLAVAGFEPVGWGQGDGVFDEVAANFYPSIGKVGFEVGPLMDGVADGFAGFALGEDGAAEGEFVDDSLESLVNAAQEGEDFGINRYISPGGLGWLEESGHACGAAAVMPVIEDAGAGDVRRSEVAGLGFAAAGLEVSDRGFVEL